MTRTSALRRGATLLLTSLVLAGCGGAKRDPDDGYLTLELDGTPRTFNVRVSANDPPSTETVHFVTVSGQESTEDAPNFGFQLVSPGVELGAFDSAHHELYGGYALAHTSYQSTGRLGSYFRMTLTRMDDDGVAGTFSGALRERGAGDEAPLLRVTNGRFSARYNYR